MSRKTDRSADDLKPGVENPVNLETVDKHGRPVPRYPGERGRVLPPPGWDEEGFEECRVCGALLRSVSEVVDRHASFHKRTSGTDVVDIDEGPLWIPVRRKS